MKKFLLPVILLASLSAHAVGERGNGGNTIDVEGIPRLKDLVDKTICSWVDGEALIRKNQLIGDVLKKLSFVDWYFAEELKGEIKDLNYCLTGKLVTIDTNDYDSLVTTYHANSKQVAIRLNRAVYIYEDLMNSMPVYDQAFLIIHEAIHTYIAQDEVMRNQKVRSSVRAIESVYKGDLASTRSYHLQMRNNSVNFPLTVESLSLRKNAVLFAIGDYALKSSLLMSVPSVERLFESINDLPLRLLAPWHLDMVAYSTLENFVYQAIHQEDIVVLRRLIESEISVRETALAILYSSEVARGSEVIRAFLSSEANIQDVALSTLKRLSTREIAKNEAGRLLIPGMELLSTNGASIETPFTELTALSSSYSELRSELKVLLHLIVILMENGDERGLEKLITSNPDFYEGFETKTLKEKIKGVSVSFELEQTTALKKVDVLINGFWKLAKSYIEPQVKQGEWAKFVRKIDQERLGYKIK